MRRRGEVELDVAEAELCEAGREVDLAWQRGRVGDIGLRRTEARRRDGVTPGMCTHHGHRHVARCAGKRPTVTALLRSSRAVWHHSSRGPHAHQDLVRAGRGEVVDAAGLGTGQRLGHGAKMLAQ